MARGIALQQQRYIFTKDEEKAKVTAEPLYINAPSRSRNVSSLYNETTNDIPLRTTSYGSARDACERSVSSLCAVGSGVGAAIACGILGLTVIADLGCAAVAALISQLGYDSAKERVCTDARD